MCKMKLLYYEDRKCTKYIHRSNLCYREGGGTTIELKKVPLGSIRP